MAFDLDNEELKATRKLHNQDDGLYEETSDKDVENIKIVIKDCREHLKLYGEAFITANELDRIEHILTEREQDKKRIQELEAENRIFKDSNVLVNRYFKLKDNSIPVQKVKDKIEELKKEYEENKDENGESEYYYPDYTIRKLEELLEDK